jgi:hypothetical protein
LYWPFFFFEVFFFDMAVDIEESRLGSAINELGTIPAMKHARLMFMQRRVIATFHRSTPRTIWDFSQRQRCRLSQSQEIRTLRLPFQHDADLKTGELLLSKCQRAEKGNESEAGYQTMTTISDQQKFTKKF